MMTGTFGRICRTIEMAVCRSTRGRVWMVVSTSTTSKGSRACNVTVKADGQQPEEHQHGNARLQRKVVTGTHPLPRLHATYLCSNTNSQNHNIQTEQSNNLLLTHTPPPHPHAHDISNKVPSPSKAYTRPRPPQAPPNLRHSSSHTPHKKRDHSPHTYHD